MALESTDNKVTYSCNGTLTGFDFTFPITADTDLEVILTTVATGVETTLTLTTHYTVTASSNDYANGGTVTTVSTYSSAYDITIYRKVPLTQPSTFTENMTTLYATFETALNRLTMIAQYISERIDSSLRLKKSDASATLELPIEADRASRYLAFDASGEPIASSGSPSSVVPVSSFMETLLDDTTASDARTTLGVTIGTNVQAYDADLALLAGITIAANKFLARASTGAIAAKDITDDALTLLDNAVAQGDLAYGSAANTWSQLAKGTEGQIIRYTATIPSAANAIVSGTAVASTSGVAIDFTSIPAWAKKITVSLDGVSTNGTSTLLIQIGDSGGVETSGYVSFSASSGSGASSTAGFLLTATLAAADVGVGSFVLSLLDAATFTWVCTGNLYLPTTGNVFQTAGTKSLSAVLDRVRITTTNGTDAFDAGKINILYE